MYKCLGGNNTYAEFWINFDHLRVEYNFERCSKQVWEQIEHVAQKHNCDYETWYNNIKFVPRNRVKNSRAEYNALKELLHDVKGIIVRKY